VTTSDQRDTRRDYALGELRRADLEQDPMAQFSQWLQAASDAHLVDATAMTLATADLAARPSARIVLLKHYDETGYVWYTGYDSRKGEELMANPQATLLFYWREFDRQVCITGSVERIERAESESYFLSRPLESQVSAMASDQSAIVENRAALEARVAELETQYADGDVPMPQNWGGYRLKALEYEFWQGRVGRLHDRFRYRADGDGWVIERLQP